MVEQRKSEQEEFSMEYEAEIGVSERHARRFVFSALRYQLHGMRRVKDEKSGAWRGLNSLFPFRRENLASEATVNSRL